MLLLWVTLVIAGDNLPIAVAGENNNATSAPLSDTGTTGDSAIKQITDSITNDSITALPLLEPLKNVTTEKRMISIAAEVGQFPYVAAIHKKIFSEFICSGAIISSEWILTGGSCMVDRNPKNLFIAVGTKTSYNTINASITYELAQIVLHKYYNEATNEYDVSLVKTSKNMEFNDRVKPITLSRSRILGITQALMISWRRLRSDSRLDPEELKYLTVYTVKHEDCRYMLGKAFDYELCTLEFRTQIDCHGNSGSILVSNDLLQGIITKGYGCVVGFPDVFTRVNVIVEWIEIITGITR